MVISSLILVELAVKKGPMSMVKFQQRLRWSGQEIDRLTGESTKNATFDVVRMAQAITWHLDNGNHMGTKWEPCGNNGSE